jgi:hypothetical protein
VGPIAWVISAGALIFDPNNHPPEWDPSTPKETSGKEDTSIHFTVRANDADNDPITYTLSGLPKGAKAEALEGAINVSWTPTADDVGVYRVIATATDGKSKVDREIKVIVEDEHESFFMPGIGPSTWVPASTGVYGAFIGFSVEFQAVRWIHQSEKRGPSHGSIYIDFDVLFSTQKAIDPAFMPTIGFDLSLERNPARRFLIPYFGLDGGALFQSQTGTLGFMTAFAGVHLWTTHNVDIGFKVGGFLPFTSQQFAQLVGVRGRFTADLSFW